MNNSQLRERLQKAVTLAKAAGDVLAVILIDLGGFKQINDCHGHQVGDALLLEVAQRLKGALRECDQVARIGGDEFVIIAHLGVTEQEPRQRGEHILQLLMAPFRIQGRSLRLGASLGISLYPGTSRGTDQLLSDADLARSRAKMAGGNCLRLFQGEMREQKEDESRGVECLRRALASNDLELHYQLQFELAAPHRPVAMEALLGRSDGAHGAVSPDRFMPLAEQQGLMIAMGNRALERACRDNMVLIEEGLLNVPVVVNISGSTFLHSDFPGKVQRILGSSGLPSSRLELQITAEVAGGGLEEAARQMARLRQCGVRLSIDNSGSGSGYCSSGALKHLPFDRLKIDRSFVAGLLDDSRDQAIVNAMLLLAKGAGVQVVAEGIETPEQLAYLQRCGCTQGQGPWYARPMPLDRLRALLQVLSPSSAAC